ncbi:uncharacterized protein LOC115889208 [Sitophilus oryzae]|uniref:Uncharacterized protein LOC115889208 n=1 Tax=Sitophilus oryzae TaxID=7048 RepID=A0A6J2YLX2_SITOR|nr:uncharacterized protein LOC115889208 [Sitophilus oryzae]
MSILNVNEKLYIDNSIVSSELHTYQPYISSKFDYNDEIRIPIQELDAYTLPSESLLYIEGKLTNTEGNYTKRLRFTNNGIAFLFREIRYELNGITIDALRNVELASTLKSYLSSNTNESLKLQNAGWFPHRKEEDRILVDDNGKFSVSIPLKLLMGFFEDYRKIIINMKQELVLIRSNNDLDGVFFKDDVTPPSTTLETPKVTFDKIYWKVPHILVDIPQQLALTRILESNKDIVIGFRSWELVEYSSLTETTRHTWPVKTTSKLEAPRHVIIAFQENRKGNVKKDMSQFDDVDLTNIRIFLNSERYPYHDLYLNFKENKYSSLYEMFANFRYSYYGTSNEPIFNPEKFKEISPIAYIDCSHQKETLQTGSVVMRIEFETNSAIKKDTSAYCLILHDKLFSYNPLTKIVKQL